MTQSSASNRESRLRVLDRWAMMAIVTMSLVPLLPYAISGIAG